MKITKSKFKRKVKETLIILSLILIIVFLFIFAREKTQMLRKENYITKTASSAYLFKKEEYLSLQTEKKIDFLVKEGTKVGANTLLSSEYKISTYRYIEEAIEVIDWCIKNNSKLDPETHAKRLNSISAEIQSLKNQISNATKKEDTEKLSELNKLLEEKEKEKDLAQRATRYLYANQSTLKRLKNEYEKKKNSSYTDLTTSNLNFSLTGIIFYETTGYENILNPDVLPALSESYFDYIDNADATPIKTTPEQAVIKITDSEFMYICAFVPEDTYVESEHNAIEKRQYVYDNYSPQKDGGYYSFLEKRIDILNSFPSIQVEINKNVYSGYLINVDTYEQRGKLLIIALKNNITDLMKINITSCKVYTESVSSYVVPKKSVIEENGKSYVYTLTVGNFTNKVEVEVYKEVGNKVILRSANNPNLKDNLEIIINPN